VGDCIGNGAVVGIDYRLTVADGTEVDSTVGRGPMEYLHGHRNIIPGLEQELEGHEVGDNVDVTVSPDQGYGEHDPERIVRVSQDQLGFEPEVGAVVSAKLPDGREQHLLIAEIEGYQRGARQRLGRLTARWRLEDGRSPQVKQIPERLENTPPRF
jgi:FKBP-type peptidyl-prolyl cis-trans isomerase SlyD